jgi:hypothetical protein
MLVAVRTTNLNPLPVFPNIKKHVNVRVAEEQTTIYKCIGLEFFDSYLLDFVLKSRKSFSYSAIHQTSYKFI